MIIVSNLFLTNDKVDIESMISIRECNLTVSLNLKIITSIGSLTFVLIREESLSFDASGVNYPESVAYTSN